MRVLALAALLACLPAAALADDARGQSRRHLARATELHQAGRYTEALDELTIAYTLDPQPELLYAIGQVHVKLGRCDQAITFYERFLSTRPAARPAALAHQAIEVCRTHPPRARRGPWYTDVIGDALVGAGVVAGGAGGLVYRSARQDLDAAETA